MDQINIYALHTAEANKHMEFLSPLHKKGAISIRRPDSLRNSIDMDIALAIYELTKLEKGDINESKEIRKKTDNN